MKTTYGIKHQITGELSDTGLTLQQARVMLARHLEAWRCVYKRARFPHMIVKL